VVVDLASADPLAAATAALTASPAVAAALARWPAPGTRRVLGEARPPWPMLQVTAGATGGTGLLRWTVRSEVLVSAWGAPDRSIGSADLRGLLYVALGVLAELPELRAVPGAPVVCDVRLSVPAQPLEQPDGQLRWFAGLDITCHPAQSR